MIGLSLLALASAPFQAVPADTVVMVAARDTVDIIFAVAAGAVALTFLALLFSIVSTLAGMRRAAAGLEELMDSVARDPGVASLRRASENVEAVSAAVRREVEHFTRSISSLSDRLTQASDRMEERIEEFNALMEVIQAEAEEVFVDTAAAARGVRTGVGRVGRAARKGRAGPERAEAGGPSEAVPGGEGPGEAG